LPIPQEAYRNVRYTSLQQAGGFTHPTGMNHIRLAVTATALVVASLVAVVFVANGSPRQPAIRVLPADGVTQPSPSSPPQSSPAPVELAGFVCGASSVPTTAAGASGVISTMRTGTHPGYDRFVVEFASGVPGAITITPTQRPTFTSSPRGDSVTLAGSAGLSVVMHDADAHTSYSGPNSLEPNGPALVEVRRIEDFEGYVGLGLGLTQPSCYRAFMLTSPTRLVIDVQVG
jgi:hypothetical protein